MSPWSGLACICGHQAFAAQGTRGHAQGQGGTKPHRGLNKPSPLGGRYHCPLWHPGCFGPDLHTVKRQPVCWAGCKLGRSCRVKDALARALHRPSRNGYCSIQSHRNQTGNEMTTCYTPPRTMSLVFKEICQALKDVALQIPV